MKQLLLKNSVSPNEHIIDRYLKFIKYYNTIIFTGYTETHHIIPRSFAGTNDKGNLIKLSARHHYIAHLLLAKATNNPKMIKALHMMVYSTSGDARRNYKITSKVYAYIREKHAAVVSSYSKNTVVAKQLYTEEIKRIPKPLFDKYNGILYEAIAKGRKDSHVTKIKKQLASQQPRTVQQGTYSRSIAASKYSYKTPVGFCENQRSLRLLYPMFTNEILTGITKDRIISKRFASSNPDFLPLVGKKWSDAGFIKINRGKK